jgi:carbamate kinase
MKQDGDRGWRHVVSSPAPRHICDVSLVETLATWHHRHRWRRRRHPGGARTQGRAPRVEAVIDKDMTSVLLANVLAIDTLLILTAVPKVAIDFGKPTVRLLDRVTLRQLEAYRAEGHFPPGSMSPKIDAAVRFLEGGG